MRDNREVILAASIVCRNELGRYLPLVIEHLRNFCDQITVLDDRSNDGTLDYLVEQADRQLTVTSNPGPTFDEHEGRVRQLLLDLTLERNPTHVLAIDADEFVGDGVGLRHTLRREPDVGAWALTMTEVWKVTENEMCIRTDGMWRPYDRVHVWATPQHLDGSWRIADRALACPPVPRAVYRQRPRQSGSAIFHFGWADPATRQARYDRYMQIDGGRHHARKHLESIVYPEDQIDLMPVPWPAASWADKARAKLLGDSDENGGGS